MTEEARDKHRLAALAKAALPILQWLPGYKRAWLRRDLVAGLSVWALLVPQAMAYATLAGLPPQAGLYAAPLAMIAYAVFGTSRQLMVGPSAAMAVMSAAAVTPLAAGDPERFIALSAILALLVGGILVLCGLLRLGLLTDFISTPIRTGFIIGLALTIIVGQLTKVTGYSVADEGFFQQLWTLITGLGETHLATLAVGLISLTLLWALHRFVPKLPSALTVVVLSILAVTFLNLEDRGVAIVGEIPAGLPPLGFPSHISASDIVDLLPGALGIALIAFAEGVAVARSYAARHGYAVSANRELIAYGASNLGAGFSQGFSVDASLGRTAIADHAGARTQISGVVAAIMVLITVAALMPLFHNLAQATLGAIVIYAVAQAIDYSKLKRFYYTKPMDFWTAVAATLGVLAIGIIEGLAFALLLSAFWLLWEARKPATAILGKVPGQDTFRDIQNYPGSETYPGLVICRFDGNLFFANARSFRDQVRSAVEAEPAAHSVLIDAESVNDIDTTALDMLQDLRTDLSQSNVDLRFARTKTRVREFLRRGGLEEAIGADRFYMSVRAGVNAYLEERRVEQQPTEGHDTQDDT